MLMSDVEIITDGGRRRRWSAAVKLRIVEETLDERASISVMVRRNGVAPNLLTRWRRLMLEGGAVAVSNDDEVTSNRSRAAARGAHPRAGAPARTQDAGGGDPEGGPRQGTPKKPMWLAPSPVKDGSR